MSLGICRPMKLLNSPLGDITFQDVVDHCALGIPEGTQLDYKRAIPRDLAKHFAAMSNTRGGLIIIGVEEDERNGLPKKWEGIAYESKILDQVHAHAGNVDPLPRYAVETTSAGPDDKVFLLVRVLEGDRTPYYVQNDANLWVRTGNTSKRIDIASPREVERLLSKSTQAERLRNSNLEQCQLLYSRNCKLSEKLLAANSDDAISAALANLRAEMPSREWDEDYMLVAVQPFYPDSALGTPSDVWKLVKHLRSGVGRGVFFPSRDNTRSIPQGVFMGEFNLGRGKREIEVLLANGLIYSQSSILYRERAKTENLQNILPTAELEYRLAGVLKCSRKFYSEIRYSGPICITLNLANLGIFEVGWLYDHYAFENAVGHFPEYRWSWTIDTEIFGNEGAFKAKYTEMVVDIIWSLHFGNHAIHIPEYLETCGRFGKHYSLYSSD